MGGCGVVHEGLEGRLMGVVWETGRVWRGDQGRESQEYRVRQGTEEARRGWLDRVEKERPEFGTAEAQSVEGRRTRSGEFALVFHFATVLILDIFCLRTYIISFPPRVAPTQEPSPAF